MKKWNKLLALGMAFSMTLALTACSGQSADTSGEAAEPQSAAPSTAASDSADASEAGEEKTYEPTTLTFWNGFTSTDGEVLQQIVDDFNASNEWNITIEMDVMPWATFNEKLPAAIAAGNAPDFVLCSSGYYAPYVEAGSFQDVSDFYELPEVNADDFDKNVVDLLYYDDLCVGVPMQMVSHYFYWDKDLYEAAGLDPESPPETFEELVENAKLLTDKSKNQYGFCVPVNNNVTAQYTMYAYGGGYVNEDETEAVFNSEENVKAFETLKTLYECSPKDSDDNTYISGQLAQFINGPWIINGLRENEINYGVKAVPACTGVEQDAAVIPVGFSIPKTTSEEHKELVYKFVNYWNTEEICTKWTKECGTPAYLLSAQANFANDPQTLALSEPLSYGHIECKLNGVNTISTDGLYPAMEEIFAGADIKTTLDKYNEVIQGILK
ncbi:ABC transporter substrate-binding protein [Eisenbergiella tayi]|uniref:sn-glycerol-3-phosphate-binding periplasmic protein UgpB n=1 Tax=Eisenbergiella tayi TaxID=1432052 RepID=A0A1E3AKQ3_9FIRM|nr:ABC transporter substrate-binding protein [Eisenbergiella tayi]ODM09358.1 sn-glycerol-3-phosphate-binding periplasmic protein UgpB precursor [Eisenbergiella tayi]OIZ62860.1 ABC transporter substrate-binding protein [Eisenbergiella tayi]